MGDRFDKIRRNLERAAKDLGSAEERIDTALWDLEALVKDQLVQRNKGLGTSNTARGPTPEPAELLVIELKKDGSSRVTKNGDKSLRLPPRLTQLLLFASSGAAGPDGIRQLQSLSKAAKSLGSSTNALSSMVYQMRQKLQDGGFDPRLLEVVRQRRTSWIRFRVREVVVIRAEDK